MLQIFPGAEGAGKSACFHGEAVLLLPSSGSARLPARGLRSWLRSLPSNGGTLGRLLSPPLGPTSPWLKGSWGGFEDEEGSSVHVGRRGWCVVGAYDSAVLAWWPRPESQRLGRLGREDRLSPEALGGRARCWSCVRHFG